MIYRIEVSEKKGFPDTVALSVKKDIEDLGFRGRIRDVKTAQVYILEGDISESDLKKICEDLLIDPITQEYHVSGHSAMTSRWSGRRLSRNVQASRDIQTIEIAYNPGVMDPVE